MWMDDSKDLALCAGNKHCTRGRRPAYIDRSWTDPLQLRLGVPQIEAFPYGSPH